MRWIAIALLCLSGCAGMGVTAGVSVEQDTPTAWNMPTKTRVSLEVTRRIE